MKVIFDQSVAVYPISLQSKVITDKSLSQPMSLFSNALSSTYDEAVVIKTTTLRKEPSKSSEGWPVKLKPGVRLKIKGTIVADENGNQLRRGLKENFHLEDEEILEFLEVNLLNKYGEETAVNGYVRFDKIFQTQKEFQDLQAEAEVEYYQFLKKTKRIGGFLSAAIDIATDISLVGPFLKLNSWRKTRNHIHNLQEIIISNKEQESVDNGTIAALLFALWEKTKKMFKKGLGAVPLAGGLVTVWHYGNKILEMYGDEPGGTREDHAKTLWKNANIGDVTAIAGIKELLGEQRGTAAINSTQGWELVINKLDSW